MGRQRNRAAQRAAGVKPANYKSKSSPCHLRYQSKRDKQVSIGHAFYRHHRKRTALKCQLATELGLPMDTKLIFRYSDDHCMEYDDYEHVEIYHGTVVVINKEDLTLVLAVRCNRFKSMDEDLRTQFNQTISDIYLHAKARNKCTINGSHKKDDMPEDPSTQDDEHVCGWMGCCGWLGGSDKDKSFGAYAMSAFTATSLDRMLTDQERMERFHKIRDFLAGRFASLSLYVFKTNLALGLLTHVPGFDEVEWQNTPNGQVFASNIAVSCDGFANRVHIDKDHTQYTFGLFSLINRQSGIPCSKEEATHLGMVDRLYFVIKKFGIKVALARCNGLYEMVWDSKIPHYTTRSQSFDGNGMKVEAEDCKVTQFGSSCQISESLVQRIQLLEKEKAKMSPLAWEKFKAERVKTYIDENSKKMDRHRLKKELRAQVAREARAAKVNELMETMKWLED